MAKSVPAAGGVIATIAMFVIARAVELLFVKVTVCGRSGRPDELRSEIHTCR